MGVLQGVGRLRASLEALANALAAPNAAGLVEAESQLSSSLAELGGRRLVEPGERAAAAVEIRRARLALERCRILGDSALDATRVSLCAQGREIDYDRAGIRPATSHLRGVGLRTRL